MNTIENQTTTDETSSSERISFAVKRAEANEKMRQKSVLNRIVYTVIGPIMTVLIVAFSAVAVFAAISTAIHGMLFPEDATTGGYITAVIMCTAAVLLSIGWLRYRRRVKRARRELFSA